MEGSLEFINWFINKSFHSRLVGGMVMPLCRSDFSVFLMFGFLFLLFCFGFFCFVLRQGFSNDVAPVDLKLTGNQRSACVCLLRAGMNDVRNDTLDSQ